MSLFSPLFKLVTSVFKIDTESDMFCPSVTFVGNKNNYTKTLTDWKYKQTIDISNFDYDEQYAKMTELVMANIEVLAVGMRDKIKNSLKYLKREYYSYHHYALPENIYIIYNNYQILCHITNSHGTRDDMCVIDLDKCV